MFNLSHLELEGIKEQLALAIGYHGEWFDGLNRRIICRLPQDDGDLSVDAHRRCRFGEWYYHHADERIREHPAFHALGAAHRTMHAHAADLLRAAQRGARVGTGEYDRFADSLRHLHMEMESLRDEVEQALNNLDPLTGVYSRRSMLSRLRELQAMVERQVQPVTLAMMDIDRFKQVNDRCGHLVGDRVLREAAQHIVHWTRRYDMTFRYGGEEFLVGLPNTDVPAALEIVERIRTTLPQDTGCRDGEPLRISVSFGVAALLPEITVEEAIHRADAALYRAKAAGRNRSLAWDSALDGIAATL